jgi:hypothetical protein
MPFHNISSSVFLKQISNCDRNLVLPHIHKSLSFLQARVESPLALAGLKPKTNGIDGQCLISSLPDL